MNLPTINSAQRAPTIHAAGCCFRSALRHPRALTSWLCLRLKLLAGQQTFHPRGGQMRSPSHIPSPPLIIIITHPSTLLTHPSLFPSHFPRCLVTLAPVILPLPSFMVEERKREGEREAAAHYHHVPRGLLLGCPSCCSVQLWLSTRPWPAGILTLPESQKKSHSVWELIVSLAAFSQGELHRHWRHLQLPNLSARAEKILFLSMAVAPRALALSLPLVLALLTLVPAPILGGCPKACRCSFAMLQCLEPLPGIASIPALAPQESENVTEMWVWLAFMYYMRWHAWHWRLGKLDFQFGWFTISVFVCGEFIWRHLSGKVLV